MTADVLAASFRDPSGFLFRRNGILYRQVNRRYRDDYGALMSSGLYAALVKARLLVPHREADAQLAVTEDAYRIIEPEVVEFISYPYEWSFSQLRDAALITLRIQKLAMEHDLSLKDASAYNIQFMQGRPVFIDTLSFEKYREGEPWPAYRQFCQHFLAPLSLMSYCDIRMGLLLRDHIDGIPLDLAAKLLPWRTRLRFSLLAHIHLHARSQVRFADKQSTKKPRTISRHSATALVDGLDGAVRRLRWQAGGTEWADYYQETNYDKQATENKSRLVDDFLRGVSPSPRWIWDLGANTGRFSRVAGRNGAMVLSADIDPAAVERNYGAVVEADETNILPLLMDLTNPSPGIGWNHQERMSLTERGPADAVLALALVHHLVISNNVPLARVAAFFSSIGRWLVIEFVPKSDSQVERLLATREDIFPDYTQAGFESAFGSVFSIRKSERIGSSDRTLYLMERKASCERPPG